MLIEIVLRTHDRSNVHTDRDRYFNIDKKSLIIGCVSSLVNSVKQVQGHQFKFKILDDHSSEELISDLHSLLQRSNWEYEIISLEEKGYNYSALKQFEACRDSSADLVYSVEDDYLHCPSAITEMLDSYELFVRNSGQEIVIYPFDMPDDYAPPHMIPCMVVHGSARHWRTGVWTTNTFMLRPKVLQDHWPIFEKLATGYNSDYSDGAEHIHEGNTICHIWKNYTLRFSPIQSLALHMQFDTQQDPFIDWKYWWDNYTKVA